MRKAILPACLVLLLGVASLAMAEASSDPVMGGDYSKTLALPETVLTDVVMDGATTEGSGSDSHPETGSYATSDESVDHTHSEECVAHTHSGEESGPLARGGQQLCDL